MNEQQRKAMKLALDYIVATNKSSEFWLVPDSNLNKTVTALREALAQDALQALHDENKSLGLYEPEQEPVAEIHSSTLRWIALEDNRPTNALLYTTPPQRTWIGLTRKEVHDLYDSDYAVFHQHIEAKLKEKNT